MKTWNEIWLERKTWDEFRGVFSREIEEGSIEEALHDHWYFVYLKEQKRVNLAVTPACKAYNFKYACTRPEGHPGPHIAAGSYRLYEVWNDDQE